MNAKQKYRAFLKTEFWLSLSAEKKALNPVCERCGSDFMIQAHHRFYRSEWRDTQLDDLETLCRSCHRKEHGFSPWRFMVYRGDHQFSRFLHFTQYLRQRMVRLGVGLKQREIWYLSQLLLIYPPTKRDSCMKFHVDQTLKMSAIAHTYK